MFRTGQVLANYWNPDFNAVLEEGQTNMDPKKRLAAYSKAGRSGRRSDDAWNPSSRERSGRLGCCRAALSSFGSC